MENRILTAGVICGALYIIHTFNVIFTFYLIISILFLIYFVKHPRRAFYLFIFFIPLSEIYIRTRFLSISAPNILILIIITSLLSKLLVTKPKINLPFFVKLNLLALFLLFGSYIMGAIHAIDISKASRFIITFMGMLISFILPLILIKNLEEYRKVFIFLVASASLLAFFTVLAGFGLIPEVHKNIFAKRIGTSRAVIGKYFTQAFIGSRGAYGCWLESALSIIMLSIFYKKKFFLKNSLLLLMAVIIILGIIIPSSRSSWLAASLAMVIVGSFVLRSRFGLPYLFTFVIGLLTILTLYGFDLIQPFIRDIYNMNPMGVDLRFLGYSEGLKIALRNPLLGIGVGGFMKISTVGQCVHNVFLNTLVLNGILGFLPLLFVWLTSFYLCVQIILRPATEAIKLFGVSLLASLIAIFTEVNLYGGGDKS